jgi:hypothetical protein
MTAHQRPFISWVSIARVVYIVVMVHKEEQYKEKCVDYHAAEEKPTKEEKKTSTSPRRQLNNEKAIVP